ncbi:MAG: S1 RNA-binding domain-containing protein [Oscillospiraceae bacterium]|nr:S1 RNA-binding domain-containing protein [Oscillospiraceae bacterium]
MDLEVGSILTGKVTGITKFGAFVTVAPGKSGLVHISEISNTYVNDVHEHLTEGQEVTVKVINIDENGRINLSIKATLPPPPPRQQKNDGYQRRQNSGGQRPFRQQNDAGPQQRYTAPRQSSSASGESGDSSFDDMLKRFMQDSDSKISGLYSDRKSRKRRG